MRTKKHPPTTILKLHQAGLTTKQIAEQLSYHPDYVSDLKKALGISRPHKTYKDIQDALQRAKPFLDDGISYCEVARTVNISPPTLKKYYPGYTWTPTQAGQHARSIRQHKNLGI